MPELSETELSQLDVRTARPHCGNFIVKFRTHLREVEAERNKAIYDRDLATTRAQVAEAERDQALALAKDATDKWEQHQDRLAETARELAEARGERDAQRDATRQAQVAVERWAAETIEHLSRTRAVEAERDELRTEVTRLRTVLRRIAAHDGVIYGDVAYCEWCAEELPNHDEDTCPVAIACAALSGK